MAMRTLALAIRLCLGIIVILNGPVNGFAIGFVVTHSCRPDTGQRAEIQKAKNQTGKNCCPYCSDIEQSSGERKTSVSNDNPSKIRPTCPVCPSCPNFPSGCCVSCPCKAPCAPPVMFAMPESPEIVWRLTDEDISFSDSHADEVLLPPRSFQFVAFTI